MRRRAHRPSPQARDVLFLINPTAGAGRRNVAAIALAAAESSGFRVTVAESPAELSVQSAQLASEGRLRTVVAVGGDGTVGAALNATAPGVSLAVVPAGTENLLAKYLRCFHRPERLGALLEEGVVIRLDAGRAHPLNRSGPMGEERLFTLMISAGLDSAVVRQVHTHRRGNITHLAYAKPILDNVRRYKYPAMRLSWIDDEGQEQQIVGRWVFGVNLPRYAQDLRIVPEANGVDGLLDFRVFERGGTVAGLWYFWHVLRRRHHLLASVTSARSATFRMESTTTDVPYQLDGDLGGVLPVEVCAVAERLSVLTSVETAERLGFETRQLEPSLPE